MEAKRHSLIISICGVFVGICVMVVSMFYHFFNLGYIYKLNLPMWRDLTHITLAQKDGDKTDVSGDGMKDILAVLNGSGRDTKKESIQDVPVNVENWVKVDFYFQSGGASTLFLYAKKDGYYMEQPYNGIYSVSKDEYCYIVQNLKQGKSP